MADHEGEFPNAILDGLLDATVGRAEWEPTRQCTVEHFGAAAAVLVARSASRKVIIASDGIAEPALRYNSESWARYLGVIPAGSSGLTHG